jgi:hypothetical protein
VGLYFVGGYLLSGLGLTETDRVLQAVYQAEEAVEQRSLLKFNSVLSSSYRDSSGLDKRSMVALATRYFQGSDRVQIIHLSSDIDFPTEETAVAEIRVQVVGRSGGTWARGLSDDSPLGEKYTIQLKKESGDWKITAVDPARGRWPRI